jgi:tRNA dimethylallyltransferase
LKVPAKNLIVIAGPTAVGKTALAVAVAQHLKTEIVSVDSRQVYREMSIGTAKPTPAEQGGIVHHFIDSHSIHTPLDAATFGIEARALLANLFERFGAVVVCGGSGLYLQALLTGFDALPPVPVAVRAGIVAQYQEKGLGWLQEQVRELDAAFFSEVDSQNPQRLMRALELLQVSGEPMALLRKGHQQPLPYHILSIGLELPRPELYARINARVLAMMERGLWQEAEQLFPFREATPLQTVGYQEIFSALEKNTTRAEAVELIQRNTRRYAKRQLTWFKRDSAMRWFNPHDQAAIFDWLPAQLRQNA